MSSELKIPAQGTDREQESSQAVLMRVTSRPIAPGQGPCELASLAAALRGGATLLCLQLEQSMGVPSACFLWGIGTLPKQRIGPPSTGPSALWVCVSDGLPRWTAPTRGKMRPVPCDPRGGVLEAHARSPNLSPRPFPLLGFMPFLLHPSESWEPPASLR